VFKNSDQLYQLCLKHQAQVGQCSNKTNGREVELMKEGTWFEPTYGRLLADFQVGELYHHPWEVTLDDGLLALWSASFLDPNPLYSSRRFARQSGFRDRVVPSMLLMNLALSSSVHDVSEQAIAHLAYINLRFPNPAYAGDTLSTWSEVLDVRTSESKPDRGVVHVRTICVNEDRVPVVTFERKALIPAGELANRNHPQVIEPTFSDSLSAAKPLATADKIPAGLPREIKEEIKNPLWLGRLRGLFDDFAEGEIILHGNGRTVGESEHMQLTMLTRNSHPLHFDEVYSRERSFMKTRVVCGPLVFAWINSLASRDTTANALWDLGYDKGVHPAPVLAGDTLFAASRVLTKQDLDAQTGIVKFQLVGVKNEKPARLIQSGCDLFKDKFEQKVFEIEREVLLPKQSLFS
jgi:2-methylfumaryl-CoA hydratase